VRHLPSGYIFGTAPDLLARYSRRSVRLVTVQRAVAYALGGQAGSRLAQTLKFPCSGDTLLRLIRQAPRRPIEPPRVIGVDDWALRRGQVYGTILVDLERHRTIDFLEDRQAQTLATWLCQNPSVQILARDRLLDYRRAATKALPGCQQVADRWHLLKNLGEALERLVTRHWLKLRSPQQRPLSATDPQAGITDIPPVRPPDHLRYGSDARHEKYLEREQLFGQMQRWQMAGLPPSDIAHQLGVARNTVRAYLARGGPPPEVSRRLARPKRIDPYVPHLVQRWQAGCRNASRLWREISALEFRGPRSLVARWVRQRRERPAANTPPRYRATFESGAVLESQNASSASSPIELPGSRALAWLLMRSPAQLTPVETTHLERLRSLHPVRIAHDLAQRFLHIIRMHSVDQLAAWLDQTTECGVRELRVFANGLPQDLAAVEAALTSPWSNGQTEGQVNKLKLLKRQMYGRAGLDLLRIRILQPP
jgi:transposase